jgi:outer membrane lipoprotein SlyB
VDDPPQDPVLDLAGKESVATPTVIPAGKKTLVYAAVGAGLGAAIAGTPGALVGGALGWTVDTIRRKFSA